MRSLDILSFILSVLGTYGVVLSTRLLLPRNIIRRVSTALNEAEMLLNRAEAINAIPDVSVYRMNLAILANRVLRFRMESHRSPGFVQQLRLVFLSGLTCRLYVLSSRIETMRLKVELMVDEQELTLASAVQSATTSALPVPAAITATPTINVAQPISVPPAAEP